jgi:hypothetical protein
MRDHNEIPSLFRRGRPPSNFALFDSSPIEFSSTILNAAVMAIKARVIVGMNLPRSNPPRLAALKPNDDA